MKPYASIRFSITCISVETVSRSLRNLSNSKSCNRGDERDGKIVQGRFDRRILCKRLACAGISASVVTEQSPDRSAPNLY